MSAPAWNRLQAAAAAAALAAPLAVQLARCAGGAAAGASIAAAEQRAGAAAPAWPHDLAALVAWPRAAETWFADGFGLRAELLAGRSQALWCALALSPSDKVIRALPDGDQAWIFSAEHGALDAWRGARPFEASELAAWRASLATWRDWLAERGVRLLVAVAPDKPHLYPERLPAAYRSRGPSRLEQWIDAVAGVPGLEILDLRPTLAAEKARDRGDDYVYAPLGTHWSQRGAYAAYVALTERLARLVPGFPAPPEAPATSILKEEENNDAWSRRLYLDGTIHQRTWRVRRPGLPRAHSEERAERAPLERGERWTGPAAELPVVFLLDDSYGEILAPWLAEHCSELVSQRYGNWLSAEIDAARPDAVVLLGVDWMLQILSPWQEHPGDSLPAGQARLGARFEAASETLARWSGAELAAALGAARGMAFECDARGAYLEARVPHAELDVDLPALAAAGALLVRAEIEAPAAGFFAIGVPNRGAHPTERTPWLERTLQPGVNVVWAELPGSGLAGPLGLALDGMSAPVCLRALEVRREVGTGR